MTRRIFVDTEWTAPPWSARCELMWVGLADEDGRTWHGVSAEVEPDAGALRLLSAEDPRLSRPQLAAGVLDFCGAVDEFWAWVPDVGRFSEWFRLGDEGPRLHERFRDVDLQMLRALVRPWPVGWPTGLHDLNAAAVAGKVEIPPRASNHLHPRVHAQWNRQLFERIRAAGGG